MSGSQSIFLKADWRNLLFISFRVPDSLLAPYLPSGLELDRFDGSALVSLVAFEFADTRFLGIRAPLFHSFAELNLRFYVHRTDSNERGVVFIKEICPHYPVAAVAWILYNESFLVLPSKCSMTESYCDYQFGGSNCSVSIQLSAEYSKNPKSTLSESLDHFLIERYLGYSRSHLGKTLRYQVMHPPWSIHDVGKYSIEANFEPVYGNEIGVILKSEPASVLFVQGGPTSLTIAERL